VHIGHPVAQRIHDQLDRARVLHVEAIARTGKVVIKTLMGEPCRPDCRFRSERGTEMIAFAGVVVTTSRMTSIRRVERLTMLLNST
jgi:hypothetical protein